MATGGALREFDRALRVVDDFVGLPKKDRALGGEGDFALISLQEGNADFAFQVAYLSANAGLRDVEVPGGEGEAAVLGYGTEVAKMAEFHDGRLPFEGKLLSVFSITVSRTNVVTND